MIFHSCCRSTKKSELNRSSLTLFFVHFWLNAVDSDTSFGKPHSHSISYMGNIKDYFATFILGQKGKAFRNFLSRNSTSLSLEDCHVEQTLSGHASHSMKRTKRKLNFREKSRNIFHFIERCRGKRKHIDCSSSSQPFIFYTLIPISDEHRSIHIVFEIEIMVDMHGVHIAHHFHGDTALLQREIRGKAKPANEEVKAHIVCEMRNAYDSFNELNPNDEDLHYEQQEQANPVVQEPEHKQKSMHHGDHHEHIGDEKGSDEENEGHVEEVIDGKTHLYPREY